MSREIHIHVEEPSMEAFLESFLQNRLDPAVGWRVIDYGSKQQLLKRLPDRLIGYSKIPQAYRPRSLILVDRDDDDCLALKAELDASCDHAGLITATVGRAGNAFEVVNRIVVEELEAWFFGDPQALDLAWPGAGRVANKAPYRDPDAIRGGTHEALLRELQRAGHLRGLSRLPKIETARTMGGLIDPARNASCSFGHFWSGLTALLAFA